MDSRTVAAALGTDPKTLRRFLRSSASSITPVGSGGRYVFDPSDMDTLATEFAGWMQTDQNARTASTPTTPKARTPRTNRERDVAVWTDEGPIVLPDIRDPRVLAEVRARAAVEELRLMSMVRRAGLTTTPRPSARV